MNVAQMGNYLVLQENPDPESSESYIVLMSADSAKEAAQEAKNQLDHGTYYIAKLMQQLILAPPARTTAVVAKIQSLNPKKSNNS